MDKRQWNTVRGCTKISPGCKHCYPESFAERFRGVPGHPYEQGFDLRLVPDKLADPLRWTTPKRVFVNSMSDLFHDEVSDSYILAVAQVMKLANWHTFQVLTKRSERMRDLLNGPLRIFADEPHIWWGVSVEDRQYGICRVEHLRATSAAVRFLSIEPRLEELGALDLPGISWVIVGGGAGLELDHYTHRGLPPSATSAYKPTSHFSSNNGVVCTSARQAGSSMAVT